MTKPSRIFAVIWSFCGLTLIAATVTVSSLLTTSCVPGSQQTAFPNCDNFNNYATCADISTDNEYKACLCNQQYLNSLFGCESEMNLCYHYDYLDPTFETALSLWHNLCNTFIAFSASTPPVSSILTTYEPDCVHDVCRSANFISTQCVLSFTDAANFTSCLCQPEFLTLDYGCEYIGNTSCLGVPATMSNLVGYDCPNFADVIGTGIGSQSVVTLSAPRTGSASLTPAPTPTSTTASQTAASSTTSEGVREINLNLALLLFCIFLPLMLDDRNVS